MTTSHDSAPGPGPGGKSNRLPKVSIVLNGERRSVAESGLSVADLVRRSRARSAGMVVVERNRRDSGPAGDLGATPVEEGDRFEFVHFVGGG